MNLFNNCTCRSSVFGLAPYGGYMDFMQASFYKDNYHVVTWWATASVFGPMSAVILISWTMRCWARSSLLWRVDEDPKYPLRSLVKPQAGDVRQWEGDPLMWLT
jgi:hypothetical protein